MRFQDLLSYRKSFELAMRIFEVSKSFPKEETYSLTDQARRSSRSVAAITIAEAFRKRRYPKHFISKLMDSHSENSETQGWLEFTLAYKYIDKNMFDKLISASEEVGKLIYCMINNPGKFGSK